MALALWIPVFTGMTVLGAAPAFAENVTPLPNAHAHNDYEHDRPLLDALDHGFCSVEADIHLVDGELLVAHDADEVDPARTLQKLYLDPLRERAAANGGRIYPDGPRFILLIDFKTWAEETYAALAPVLESYKEILTRFTPDSTEERAVTVILSGDRPIETVRAQAERYAAIDGRFPDLEGDVSPHLFPMVSDSWWSRYGWTGRGEMPDKVRVDMVNDVKRAHEKGCIVRFWALPHNEDLWRFLLDSGVDLINVDDLARLQAFLLQSNER
jgi:glycerophosphoryl diester phosphodiesterase